MASTHKLGRTILLPLGGNSRGSIVDHFVGGVDWTAHALTRQLAAVNKPARPWMIERLTIGARTEGLEMLEYRIAESYVQRYHMLAHGRTATFNESAAVSRGWEKLLSSADESAESIEHVAVLGEN